MKLSEAIRLGAMLSPGGHGHLYLFGKTCALGAALEARGELLKKISAETSTRNYDRLDELWPVLTSDAAHPGTGGIDTLRSVIWSLNDVFGWTREQIADYVETIEAQHEIPQSDSVAVTAGQ